MDLTRTISQQTTEHLYSAADLPLLDGKLYHLALSQDQLAPNIILVGDPERVPLLAGYSLVKEGLIDVSRRGLRTITGQTATGLPVSIIATGMGTPSVEIVINEIIALNEIDLQTRKRREKPLHTNLNILRLGTCGALQRTTLLGTFIITKYVIGLDNTGLFYTTPQKVSDVLIELEKMAKEKLDNSIEKNSRFYGSVFPYASAASPDMVQALYDSAIQCNAPAVKGITISNSGFFANQGRDISRLKLTVPDIDSIFSALQIEDVLAENMDTDTSFLCHFVGSLGYRIGSMCVALAHRPTSTFYYGDYEAKMRQAMNIAIGAFSTLS